MKRWQKVLVFLVGMSFFVAIGWGIGQAVTWLDTAHINVCGENCAAASGARGAIFWIQIIGLALMSVCGIVWIVLPDETDSAH